MVGVDLTINNLPKCFNQQNCICLHTLFVKPLHYDPEDVLQYTSFNLKEIGKYIQIVESHGVLDQYLNSSQHSHVLASEIDKATEHFQETVSKLQIELLKQHIDKGELFCKYFNEDLSVIKLTDFYKSLAQLNSISLRLFNKPNSPMPTKYLLDVLEMHQYCLYIFDSFYTIIHYGRPIYKKDTPNINIHGFYFKPLCIQN
jgi:hypothetical protein